MSEESIKIETEAKLQHEKNLKAREAEERKEKEKRMNTTKEHHAEIVKTPEPKPQSEEKSSS